MLLLISQNSFLRPMFFNITFSSHVITMFVYQITLFLKIFADKMDHYLL